MLPLHHSAAYRYGAAGRLAATPVFAWCRRPGSNRHAPHGATVFETVASTSSATSALRAKLTRPVVLFYPHPLASYKLANLRLLDLLSFRRIGRAATMDGRWPPGLLPPARRLPTPSAND